MLINGVLFQTLLDGHWVNGAFTEGKWVFPDGAYMKSRFHRGVPVGTAVWVLHGGVQVSSRYEHKKDEKDESENKEDGEEKENSEGDEAPPVPKGRPEFGYKFLDTMVTMMVVKQNV
eukprot:GHVU01114696.1.p3 GENE.GHVU01114696.1~~GHVU01114696.1.p3  ORF type:complete len:117 (+),score=19.43 GHVU01114696.1:341-691(+)